MAFTAPVDILNRANQRVGAKRVSSFNDQTSKSTQEGAACYDTLRQTELESNLWRFATRRVILRSIGIDTVTWTPPTWAAGTFAVGAIAAYTPTTGPNMGDAVYWQTNAAKTGSNTTTPDQDADWTRYDGPVTIDLYDTGSDGTGTNTYMAGEVVLVPAAYAGGTTYALNAVVKSGSIWYVSLVASNVGNAVTDTTKWAVWENRGRSDGDYGQTAGKSPIPLVYPAGYQVYLSLYTQNADNPAAATTNWLALNGTIAPLNVIYPLGAGPSNDLSTANIFRLPYGFLRRAPTDPKAAVVPYLGAMSGSMPEDWLLEDQYIVTRNSGPIMMRYVADVIDVTLMDALFCEALGAKIAAEITETVLQDAAKGAKHDRDYAQAISRARGNNMIEIGPITQVENRYVTVRG